MKMCVFFWKKKKNYEWPLCIHDASAFRVLLEMQQRQRSVHRERERAKGVRKRRRHQNATSALTLQHNIYNLHIISTCIRTCTVCAMHTHSATHSQKYNVHLPVSLFLFDLNCFISPLRFFHSSSSFYLSSGLCVGVCMCDCNARYSSNDGSKSSCICLNLIVKSVGTIHFIFEM